MGVGEFNLIQACFAGQGGNPKAGTRLGIGDDASIHHPARGMDLVVSTDSSIESIHWPSDFPLSQAADRAVCAALSWEIRVKSCNHTFPILYSANLCIP
ncbi:MAG: hypothetical protein R8L58_02780 [Mariprofundaceae bacterium]